jgi:preprotein translocase subunit Sec61beta
MADNKIQMPSSGGGLVRYSDEVTSKLVFSPWVVVGAIAVLTVVGVLLYKGII